MSQDGKGRWGLRAFLIVIGMYAVVGLIILLIGMYAMYHYYGGGMGVNLGVRKDRSKT